MAKTKLAKKRRLARAHAHQTKTYTRPGVLKGEVVYQRAQQSDPWPSSPAPPRTREEVRVSLAELQAEFNATGEAHVIVGHTALPEKKRHVDPGPPAEPPARAKCPTCEKSQKVRKDGTFGVHGGCAGEGTRWDAS